MTEAQSNAFRIALGMKAKPYQSPFAEGLQAAGEGVGWTQCPYTGKGQDYERGEWLRGHGSHARYN